MSRRGRRVAPDTNRGRVSQRTVEDEALLDATQACVLAVGVRRTTMTDVARRAGVSRMTLYRRYADVTSLMQALMTREFTQILGRGRGGGRPRCRRARERLVDGRRRRASTG